MAHTSNAFPESSAALANAEEAELAAEPAETVPDLNLRQMILYGTGGIAGGLVFTMMNNALPLFLGTYRMPAGIPFIAGGSQIPATIVSLLANERSFFGGLIQPLVGQWSDRTHTPLGKRSPFILAGGIGAAIAISLLALHPSFWLMIATVTATGIALYVAVGPYSTLLADITPYHQRGRVGGLMAVGGVLGAIAFSLISIALWEQARGWVFLLTAAGVALSLTVVALGVREPHHLVITHSKEGGERTALWQEVLGHRPLAFYIVSMAIYWLGAGAAAPFITRFGVYELHIPAGNAFTLLLVIVLATTVGAVLSGFLADKVGRKHVLQPALVLFALAALVGSQVQTLGQALPVMVLVGLGNAAPTALYLPLLADLVPKKRAGVLMGFANMIWSVAQPIGSLFAGALVDITGSYRGVFIFAGICMLGAVAVMHFVRGQARLNQPASM